MFWRRWSLLYRLTDRIAGLFANRATDVLFGSGEAGGGFVPEFGHARGLMKDHNWADAIKEIEEQLRKDPLNFEGMRLLISCHLDLDQPHQALDCADRLLQSPHLTLEQRQWTKAASEQLRAAALRKAQS